MTPKKPKPHDLPALLAAQPEGRRRVAFALLTGEEARTYGDVAAQLGISLGTVHTHLRRLRLGHPGLYAAIMQVRQAPLAERHAAAVRRAECHSAAWHRRQANRRFYCRFGYWPWERRR